jgi:drug/metabolite transporter (DMT)-like permease
MKIINYWIFIGIISGLLFGIATPFSKILLFSLNSFQLSGLLYLGSGIVIIPTIIKKFISFSKSKNKNNNINNLSNYNNNYNIYNYNNNPNNNSNNNNNNPVKFLKKGYKLKFDKNMVYILFIILFGGILGPLFLMIGLSHTTASTTAIWLNMELVATAILGIILFKDHLDKYAYMGLLFTFIAGLIVSWGNGFGDIYSIVFIILACFSWGVDNQLTSIVDGFSPEVITFVKGIFGGGINFTIGMLIAKQLIPLDIVFYGIILGVISYGLSIVLFVSSAQNLGATRTQILFSTSPFWGILFSVLLIGEQLSLNLVVATLFLILGIVITNNLVHKHGHRHEKMEHIHIHAHDDSHHDHDHYDEKQIVEETEIPNEKNSKDNKSKKHIHIHIHEEKDHDHKHFPDLHHKHDH